MAKVVTQPCFRTADQKLTTRLTDIESLKMRDFAMALVTLTMHLSLICRFSNVCHYPCVWPTALNLHQIFTHFICFLVMWFILLMKSHCLSTAIFEQIKGQPLTIYCENLVQNLMRNPRNILKIQLNYRIPRILLR